MTGIRVRNAGERAVLLELPDNESARRAATALRRLNGLVDVVPAHRTVLVTWSTGPPPDELVAVGEAALGDEQDVAPARLVEIPVDYAGDDLADVARISSLSTEEVVARHVAGEYVVAFLGFAPGFAYLLGGDARLHVPRLAEPRPRVPAGSVALAGPYSGVYPRESPGGWRLIGRTTAVLFDPLRSPPALLAAGDRVRFVAT